jgi:hypothetical protein
MLLSKHSKQVNPFVNILGVVAMQVRMLTNHKETVQSLWHMKCIVHYKVTLVYLPPIFVLK